MISKSRNARAIGLLFVALMTILSSLPLQAQSGMDRDNQRIRELQAAVDRAKRTRGAQSDEAAQAVEALGQQLERMGRYDEAIKALDEALKIAIAVHGPEHRVTAQHIFHLGKAYESAGDFAKALALCEKSLAMLKSQLGPRSASLATVLNSMSNIYSQLGDNDRAIGVLSEALEIANNAGGDQSTVRAVILNNLGGRLRDAKRFDEAKKCFEASLQIRQRILRPNDPAFTASYTHLAILAREMGDYKTEVAWLEKVYEFRRANSEPDSVGMADISYNLARVRIEAGRYDEATKLLDSSLNTWRQRAGDWLPKLSNVYSKKLFIYAHEKKWTEAMEMAERARQINHRQFTRVLPGLPYQSQLGYVGGDDFDYDTAISLAVLRASDPATVDRSAEWVLNRKGLAQEAMAQSSLLARDQSKPETADLIKQLASVRARLAAMVMNPPPNVTDAYRQEVSQLNDQEYQLSARLAQSIGRVPKQDSWIKLADVRAALPADAVLVEFSRYRHLDFDATGAQKLPSRIGAWVIPAAGKGSVALIDLGSSEPIESAVEESRKLIDDVKGGMTNTEIAASAAKAAAACRALAKRVLDPVLPAAGSATTLVLSPDNVLWLVPWAALPLDDGRFAVEKYAITHVICGRDLLAKFPTYNTTAPLMLADPDYALSPAAARQQEAAIAARAGAKKKEPIKPLPGTAREAQAVQPHLAKYAGGAEVTLLMRERAVERAVKSARSPRALVISTHGFFWGLPKGASSGSVLDNPLVRCGLIFAGADHAGDLVGAAQDDGMLSGWEILGIDLRGTELVVLSACETGLGDVRIGEGVGGLRQAFQLAGAQNVVATLWTVPDQASADLMISFFTNLADGKSKAEALRQAQLALIKQIRDIGHGGHPKFWAGYTLTGTP